MDEAQEQIDASLVAWVNDAATRLGQDRSNAERCAAVVSRFLQEAKITSLDDLRAPGLMRWLGGEAQRKAPRTVRNELAAIRQWSRYLHASGEITVPPFETIKVARCVSDDGCDPLSAKQAVELIENARADLNASHHARRRSAPSRIAAYLLMLDAGLRVGEVRAQEWKDINWKACTMKVTRDKAGRGDIVPLSRRTMIALRMLRIIANRENPGCERIMYAGGPNAKTMRADLDRVGCDGEGGRFHRLRKHAVTERAKSGWSVWRLAAFARHRDPKTTARYVRLSPDDLRMA